MRVLLTGSTGFLGRAVLRRLAVDGHAVTALVRRAAVSQSAGAEVAVADLGDTAAVARVVQQVRPDACIHLAWQGIPDYSEPVSQFNLQASIDLFRALAAVGTCRKILVSGSCFEYGITRGACAETDVITVNSYFSWAKHALRLYATILSKDRNIDVGWFRIFYVYGPNQRPQALIPSIVASLRRGSVPELRNPRHANDFVYVDDVADAFGAALTRPLVGGIYNLGSGEATAVGDVCLAAAREIAPDRPLPRLSDIGDDRVRFWADTAHTRDALGWSAATDLRSGIRRYCESLEPITSR